MEIGSEGVAGGCGHGNTRQIGDVCSSPGFSPWGQESRSWLWIWFICTGSLLVSEDSRVGHWPRSATRPMKPVSPLYR